MIILGILYYRDNFSTIVVVDFYCTALSRLCIADQWEVISGMRMFSVWTAFIVLFIVKKMNTGI